MLGHATTAQQQRHSHITRHEGQMTKYPGTDAGTGSPPSRPVASSRLMALGDRVAPQSFQRGRDTRPVPLSPAPLGDILAHLEPIHAYHGHAGGPDARAGYRRCSCCWMTSRGFFKKRSMNIVKRLMGTLMNLVNSGGGWKVPCLVRWKPRPM